MSEEVCAHCGQKIEQKMERGLHNWKNLFKAPTLNDWIMLFIIAMVLVGAWAYNYDTKTCRETLNNLGTICMQYSQSLNNMSSNPFTWQDTNLSNLNITYSNFTETDTMYGVINNETNGTAGL